MLLRPHPQWHGFSTAPVASGSQQTSGPLWTGAVEDAAAGHLYLNIQFRPTIILIHSLLSTFSFSTAMTANTTKEDGLLIRLNHKFIAKVKDTSSKRTKFCDRFKTKQRSQHALAESAEKFACIRDYNNGLGTKLWFELKLVVPSCDSFLRSRGDLHVSAVLYVRRAWLIELLHSEKYGGLSQIRH